MAKQSRIPFSAVAAIVPHFFPDTSVVSIEHLGEGNINDTFQVEFPNRSPVVLQQINREVFPDPIIVADNVHIVSDHIRKKKCGDESEKVTVRLIQTDTGENCFLDDDGNVWRMINYIGNTIVHTSAVSAELAFEGGRLLGGFHHYLEDLPADILGVALADFHNLPQYCSRYAEIKKRYRGPVSADVSYCLREADKRLVHAELLEKCRKSGILESRVIHGDAKVSNMLFDAVTGQGVTMIDFDTVGGGLVLCDIGDCLRSFCNTQGETPENPKSVVFDLERCHQLLRGYGQSGALLSRVERGLVYQGVRLLTYELAVRFLTDYLEGNRYFKVTDEQENLQRSLSQFYLLESIERQRSSIELAAEKYLKSV